jgi:hypothetical protein
VLSDNSLLLQAAGPSSLARSQLLFQGSLHELVLPAERASQHLPGLSLSLPGNLVKVLVSIFVLGHRVTCTNEHTADLALSQKLHEELKYEKENVQAEAAAPEFLKAFQESGVWKVSLLMQLLLCIFLQCFLD